MKNKDDKNINKLNDQKIDADKVQGGKRAVVISGEVDRGIIKKEKGFKKVGAIKREDNYKKPFEGRSGGKSTL